MASLESDNLLIRASNVVDAYNEYMQRYGSGYSREVFRLIKEVIWDPNPKFSCTSTIRQIHAAIGCYPDHENVYKGFVDIVRATMGLNRNILALCTGEFPIMPFYIDEEQIKMGAGSISCYDIKTIVSRLGTIRIHQENIYAGTKLNNIDLVIAHNACDGIYDAIDLANENDLDAVISPCHGVPDGESFDHNRSVREIMQYHDHLYQYYERNLPKGRVLSKVYMSTNYNFPNPIFISRR